MRTICILAVCLMMPLSAQADDVRREKARAALEEHLKSPGKISDLPNKTPGAKKFDAGKLSDLLNKIPMDKGKIRDAKLLKMPIVVTVGKGGQIYLGDEREKTMTLEALAPKLRAVAKARGSTAQPVYVRGDKSLPYGTILRVMAEIRKAGFQKLSLVTRDEVKAPNAPQAGTPKGKKARLTASQVSLLGAMMKREIARCWNINSGLDGVDRIVVQVEVKLKPDGRLKGQPKVVNQGRGAVFQDAAKNAVRALVQCEPYKLPKQFYKGGWDHMVVTFDPQKMF